MQRWQVQLAILLIVCLVSFFVNLGTPRLWDRDEPRNAGAASEMAARGDWVTPIFNHELRAQKPILTYWLILSAYAWLGETEFAARFWSAALSSGTVLWTWLIARRLLGPSCAIWPPLALATFLMFSVAAHAATPDAPLIFCFTSAIGFWVLTTFRSNSEDRVRTWSDPGLKQERVWFPRSPGASLLIYAPMGLGVLAKGPVGFVLPVAIIGLFNLLARLDEPQPQHLTHPANPTLGSLLKRIAICLSPWQPMHFARTTWSMRPLLGISTVLLIAAPWYVLVGLQTQGDFLEAFFLREHLGRATEPMENHSGGVWFYPAALLFGTFPWSILALPLIVAVDRALSVKRSDRPLALVLGLSWIGLVVLAFTLASTKLPSYITPCHAGAALVYGWYVGGLAQQSLVIGKRWRAAVASVLGLVAIALAVAVTLAAGKLAPDLQPLAALSIIPMLGAILILLSLKVSHPRFLPSAIAGIALLWSVAIFGYATVQVDRLQRADDLFIALRNRPDVQLASYGKLESSWVFYAQHPILELDLAQQNQVQIRDGELQRPHPWSVKPRPTLATFLELPGEHFVVVTGRDRDLILERAAGRLTEIARVPEFLNDDELVLLGPPQTDRTAWESQATLR